MSQYLTLTDPQILLDAGATTFDELALRVFYHQYHHTAIYNDYCDIIGRTPQYVRDITDIPFLPISFFKTHRVLSASYSGAALTFESSGTTGEVPSRHFVADAAIYERSLLQGFQQFYGSVQQYAILALLPSYLERKNASLVHMARTLMAHSEHPANGFYINEWDKLHDTLQHLEQNGQQTLLLGVTFALLDFAAAHPMHLRHTIVMETGGMKGRREELTRTEVHDILKQQFGLQQVHSEYGMTELLSQAYATSSGIFRCTNTMKVLVRDINDPLDVARHGTGAINVIDLANIHSCSFIATEDMAHLNPDSTFEVLGRMDHSALRGCSLMAV